MRHEYSSTISPANPGPINPGTTQAAANIPSALGLSASGYIRPITTYIDTRSMPSAKPCTLRPIVSTNKFGAKPAIKDPMPSVNIARVTIFLTPMWSAHKPANVIPSKDAIVKLVNATA
ncbi:unannotated protein [freshwater metagenome]|uniref:Unannotated protein n=1 Tax=freshwater metagenome TaxID=449393 RepID=A0A6J6UBK2_9ZZZZ